MAGTKKDAFNKDQRQYYMHLIVFYALKILSRRTTDLSEWCSINFQFQLQHKGKRFAYTTNSDVVEGSFDNELKISDDVSPNAVTVAKVGHLYNLNK